MHCLTESDLPDEELYDRMYAPFARVELKIGISTGRFLCRLAAVYKDRLFVGLEIKPYSSQIAAKRTDHLSLTNVIIINIEATRFISKWVADNTFETIHIYFPTPFPSAVGLEHHLIYPDFIEQAYRVLKPWGTLRLVTDRQDYFNDACSLFGSRRWWATSWKQLALKLSDRYYVGTPHEIEYRDVKGVPIYALQVVKVI